MNEVIKKEEKNFQFHSTIRNGYLFAKNIQHIRDVREKQTETDRLNENNEEEEEE